MKTLHKIFLGLLVIVAIIVAGIKYLLPKILPANTGPKANVIMTVGGDPRMLNCVSAKDAQHQNLAAFKALKLESPLTIPESASAIYRVSIIRNTGKSISVVFETPKKSIPGKVTVGTFDGTNTEFESANLISEQAKAMVDGIATAKIWGALKPVVKINGYYGEASAVIEVAAPKISKCVSTRYDDERIIPILTIFEQRIPAVLNKVSLEGFNPKAQELFGKTLPADKGR